MVFLTRAQSKTDVMCVTGMALPVNALPVLTQKTGESGVRY